MAVKLRRLWSHFKNLIGRMKILRSLKARIFIIIFLVGLVSSLIMHFSILENYEERAVSLRYSDVQTQLKILANHLITYGYLQDTSSEVINAELAQLSNFYDGRVLIINDALKVVKDTYAISEGKIIISEEVIKCLKNGNSGSIFRYDRVNGYIEMTTPIMETMSSSGDEIVEEENKDRSVRGVMLTSVSTDSIMATVEILSRKAMIMEIILIFVVFGIALVLSNVLIRPFDRITKAISEVREGYTNDPISVPDYLETEHIVDAFNQLLTRMKTLDDTRQEFVSNVSHELKTPITSVKVLADSLLAQQEVSLETYKEFMADIAEEIDREDKIINDLLSLVKMDKTVSGLNISVVDINALTEIILKRLRPIARKRDIELVFESKRPVKAEVDEVKLTLILTNLVENAIKYNNDHGRVKVELDADHQFFTICVMDNGIGIPKDSQEHIFERFYRVDKSRSREIGGTGLGLAITRSAVLMHRGSIRLSSEENVGTAFTVKIPLIYIAAQ